MDNLKKLFPEIEFKHYSQYQFVNKGINELLMLLSAIENLPEDEEIFKLSARYQTNENFICAIDPGYDFKVRGYNYLQCAGTISTRAYFVKNKIIYSDFLLKTFNEVFAYPHRILNIGSLLRSIKNYFKPQFIPALNISIEFSAARVLKNSSYKVKIVDIMGVEGIIAGGENKTAISE